MSLNATCNFTAGSGAQTATGTLYAAAGTLCTLALVDSTNVYRGDVRVDCALIPEAEQSFRLSAASGWAAKFQLPPIDAVLALTVTVADINGSTAQSQFNLVVVKDGQLAVTVFGADPTGSADSLAAVNAAYSALAGTGIRPLFTAGTYKLSAAPTQPANLPAPIIAQGATFTGPGAAAFASSARGESYADLVSLVPGDITTPHWTQLYPNDTVRMRPGAAADGSYYDLVHLNRDGAALGNGMVACQFVAPPGATSVTFSVPAQAVSGSPSIEIDILSSSGAAIASTTCALTGTLTTYSVTANVTAGTEYRAAIRCNSGTATAQAQAYIGRVAVAPTGATGSLTSAFVRLDANASTLQDNSADEYVSRGYFRASALARMCIETDAPSVALEYHSNLVTDGPGYCQIGVLVNGRPYTTITPATNDAIAVTEVSLPVGRKTVTFVGSATSNPTQNSVEGSFLRGAYVGAGYESRLVTTPGLDRRLTVYGDSITVAIQAAVPPLQGWTQILRNGRYRGSVLVEAFGYRALYYDTNYNGQTLTALVRRLADGRPTDIVLLIGTNDYNHSVWSTVSSFQTEYQALLTALLAQAPQATIWAVSPISAAVEYQNSLGQTLPQFRSAISAAVTAVNNTRCVFVDGTLALQDGLVSAQSKLADGLHPNTTTGNPQLADFVSAKISEEASTTSANVLLAVDFTAMGVGGVAAGAGASTAFESRTGLRLARASAATVQTGPNTIDSSPATDYARIGQTSNAGSARGLVIEESRTNLLADARNMSSASWSAGTGTYTSGYAYAPDDTTGGTGSKTAGRVQCSSGQYGPYQSAVGTTNTTTFSRWVKQSAASAQSVSEFFAANVANEGGCLVSTTGAAWVREIVTFTPSAAAPSTMVSEEGRDTSNIGGIAAGARDSVCDLFQIETAQFATEAIASVSGNGSSTTRAADHLCINYGASIVSGGCVSLAFTLIPKGGATQYGAKMQLWYVDANNQAYIDNATQKLTVIVGGTSQTLATAMSWNAGDTVQVFVRAGGGQTTYASYAVNGGAKVALGTGAALGNVAPAGGMDLLCQGTTQQFTAWVQMITAWAAGQQPAWA